MTLREMVNGMLMARGEVHTRVPAKPLLPVFLLGGAGERKKKGTREMFPSSSSADSLAVSNNASKGKSSIGANKSSLTEQTTPPVRGVIRGACVRASVDSVSI